jgi:hypothetical protein
MTIHKSKGLQFPVVILPYDFGDGKFTDLGWIGNEQTTELGLPIISSKLTKKLNEIGFSETTLTIRFNEGTENLSLIIFLSLFSKKIEPSPFI